jgi:NAD(P)-dependent dehydrogenase (short-subunit alcohol dehydrogenase family)
MQFDLTGSVALITGGAGDIGRATATAMVAAGSAVAVTDIDGERAEETAAALRATNGVRAIGLKLDVADEHEWKAAVAATVDEFGPITILHSNAALLAAVGKDQSILDIDMELWDSVISVNLRGAVLGCRAVLPAMLEHGGGKIILTSSIASFVGSKRISAYSISKAGLNALARSVATSFGPSGIRCNVVAPGIIASEKFWTNTTSEWRAAIAATHLSPRAGVPEDVAGAVLFLASEASDFINGQVLAVDGGLTAHAPALSI